MDRRVELDDVAQIGTAEQRDRLAHLGEHGHQRRGSLLLLDHRVVGGFELRDPVGLPLERDVLLGHQLVDRVEEPLQLAALGDRAVVHALAEVGKRAVDDQNDRAVVLLPDLVRLT